MSWLQHGINVVWANFEMFAGGLETLHQMLTTKGMQHKAMLLLHLILTKGVLPDELATKARNKMLQHQFVPALALLLCPIHCHGEEVEAAAGICAPMHVVLQL